MPVHTHHAAVRTQPVRTRHARTATTTATRFEVLNVLRAAMYISVIVGALAVVSWATHTHLDQKAPLPVAQVAASDPNPVRVCQDDGYQYCTLAQAAVSNAHDHAALPQPAPQPTIVVIVVQQAKPTKAQQQPKTAQQPKPATSSKSSGGGKSAKAPKVAGLSGGGVPNVNWPGRGLSVRRLVGR